MLRNVAFVVCVGALGASVLVGLGIWQVQRLEWKLGVLAAMDARIMAEPARLPAHPDPEEDIYLAVAASGEIRPGELLVLAGRRNYGPGFRLVVPFETEGRRILLDRGFLPEALRDRARPTGGGASVVGNLHWPDEIDPLFTPEPDGRLWFARDVPSMAAELETEPVLIVAREESPAPSGIAAWPVDSSQVPNDHFEYAVTWFSMAAAWLGMTGFWLWRIGRRSNLLREG